MARTHGLSHTREHRIWRKMLERCSNENHAHWGNYGGRGIKVCDKWKDFEQFLLDMGMCPDGLELDRINNDGNYEPGNCRWAARKVNCRNRRSNIAITIGDITFSTLMEVCEKFGINYDNARRWVKRYGEIGLRKYIGEKKWTHLVSQAAGQLASAMAV